MPNFVKISSHIKKFFIQELNSDRSVPTNEPLLGIKRTWTKFQKDISKTEGPVHVYTAGRVDEWIYIYRIYPGYRYCLCTKVAFSYSGSRSVMLKSISTSNESTCFGRKWELLLNIISIYSNAFVITVL